MSVTDRAPMSRIGVPARWRAFALAIVIAPIIVATVRVLIRGFAPVGDNGILVVRAHDVLTRHNPLLGSWTSASVVTGEPVNNPGPLYFDLVSLPVKFLGHSVGLAAGVALVNVTAAVIAVLVAERLAGRTAMLATAAGVVALEWTMGSELLFDIWQPHALLLPAMAFFAAAWGLACGRTWFLPLALGIASVIAQTHLSYVYLVPVTLLGAGVVAVLTRGDRDVAWQGGWRRPLICSGCVLFVAWLQTFVQQFTAAEGGNLSGLLDAASQDSERVGLGLGARLMAEVLVTPPFIGRSSFIDSVPNLSAPLVRETVPVVGLGQAAAGLAILVAILAGLVHWRRRRHEYEHSALGMVSLILLGGCALSLTLMPVGIGGLVSHQLRWLWPVGAIILTVLLAAAASALRSWSPRLVADSAPASVGLVLALWALPTYVSAAGPTTGRSSLSTAGRLDEQLDTLEGRGPLLFDPSTLLFAEPYSGYLFAELRARGIPFVFDDEVLIRQFGEGRRDRGEAKWRIWILQGVPAIEAEAERGGIERIALARGLDATETAELRELERELRAAALENGLQLNEDGRRAAEEGRLPPTALQPDPGQHPFEAIGDLNLAVSEGWLDLTAEQQRAHERFVALRTRQAFGTVAVFIAPVDVEPSD